MKIILKLRTVGNGYKFVRCCSCNQKRVFRSWRATREYAKQQGSTNWKATRID